MAVIKRKDIDWKAYLRQLAESSVKMSSIEKIEFSGYLLRRDIEFTTNISGLLNKIFCMDNYSIADVIASFLIAESPDTTNDLIKEIQIAVSKYYENEILSLIEAEEKQLEREKIELNNLYKPEEEWDSILDPA
jgi:hypothetical protein